MPQERPSRERLFTIREETNINVESLDEGIRDIFRHLLDQIDVELQKRGLDHDDVEHERYLMCQLESNEPFQVPADMADLPRLASRIRNAATPSPGPASQLMIVAAEVAVWRDEWQFYPG
ncbi:MAG: hypothetical protein ACPGXK_07505 [Phycisphaerae bacterium]